MVKLSTLMPDPSRDKDGVWQTFALGVRARIARANNPRYQAARRKAFHPHRARLRRGEMPIEELLAIERGLHAEFYVLDWDGIDDETTGAPVPYSTAKCVEYLSDPRFQLFYEWVLETAGDMDLFRAEAHEEDLGNSSPASAGSSNGGSTSQSSKSPSVEGSV